MALIDENQPAPARVSAFWPILGEAVDSLDAGRDEATRANVRRFLLHVAWHEGMHLTKREQLNGGPGRSFFQFEAYRAKETLQYAQKKGLLGLLAGGDATLAAELPAATAELPDYQSGVTSCSFFPAGCRIEALLTGDDGFATRLARIAFRMIPAAIPTDNAGHAEYWYKWWKRSGGDETKLVATVTQEADEVDQLIPKP